MKEITVYEAIDGERFDRKSACRAYELLLGRVLRVTENSQRNPRRDRITFNVTPNSCAT